MMEAVMLGSLGDVIPAGRVIGGAIVGFGLGMAYFGSLWWNVRTWVGGSWLRAAMAQILRFALVGIVFFGLAKLGAAPLLAGALGLIAARALVLRRFGRSP